MISYFRELSESGAFNAADEFQLYLLRFCFGDLVEQELREMQEYWNAHRIRRSQYAQVAGHPNILYTLPHLTNGEDQLKTFEEDDLELIEEHIAENNTERFMIPPLNTKTIFRASYPSLGSPSFSTWITSLDLYNTIMSLQ